MYIFEITVIQDLEQTSLNNLFMEGIPLNSELDILINYAQQDLISTLRLTLNNHETLNNQNMSWLNASRNRKEKPFRCSDSINCYMENISDREFDTLSEHLKKCHALKEVSIVLCQALPPTQERALMMAIDTQKNIEHIFVQSIEKNISERFRNQYPHLITRISFIEFFKDPVHASSPYAIHDQQETSKHASKLFYTSTLLLTFGFVALASALVLMNSILALLSASLLALGTYAYCHPSISASNTISY